MKARTVVAAGLSSLAASVVSGLGIGWAAGVSGSREGESFLLFYFVIIGWPIAFVALLVTYALGLALARRSSRTFAILASIGVGAVLLPVAVRFFLGELDQSLGAVLALGGIAGLVAGGIFLAIAQIGSVERYAEPAGGPPAQS